MASRLWQAHNREERLFCVGGGGSFQVTPTSFWFWISFKCTVSAECPPVGKDIARNQQAVGCEWGRPEHGGDCWRPGFDAAPFLVYTYLATFHSEDLVDSVDAHGCVITGLSELEWWRGASMIGIMVEPLGLTDSPEPCQHPLLFLTFCCQSQPFLSEDTWSDFFPIWLEWGFKDPWHPRSL